MGIIEKSWGELEISFEELRSNLGSNWGEDWMERGNVFERGRGLGTFQTLGLRTLPKGNSDLFEFS